MKESQRCATYFINLPFSKSEFSTDTHQVYQFWISLRVCLAYGKALSLPSWLWHYNLEPWSIMLSGPCCWFLTDIS